MAPDARDLTHTLGASNRATEVFRNVVYCFGQDRKEVNQLEVHQGRILGSQV